MPKCRRGVLTTGVMAFSLLVSGCTGNGDDEPQGSDDETPSDSESTAPPESEEPEPSTDEPSRFGLPSCDSGDYLFQVINTGTENGALYINIKNLQATPVEISQIILEMDFPDHGKQEVDTPMGTGGTGGKESFDGGETGSIFVEFDAFEDGVYLDNSDFEPQNIEDIRITNVHYGSEDYDGSVCE